MKKLLLLAILAISVATVATAQDQWNFVRAFSEAKGASGHGIAVDPDGKIWVQNNGITPGDSIKVAWEATKRTTRSIQIFNPDGTPASFSPLLFINGPGGAVDTVGGRTILNATGAKAWEVFSGRGLETDEDGNIIAGIWDMAFRIDYKTGAGLSKVVTGFPNGLIKPAIATDNGNVFLGNVFAGQPLREYTKDFTLVGNALNATRGFSRTFEVSPNGNRIYWTGYTNRDVILYERPSEFESFDSLGVVIPGMSAESISWHPTTGHLWVSAGSPNDLPNLGTGTGVTNWLMQTWYAFDPAELAVGTVPTPKAFFTWNGGGDGRPRGLAFSPDGTTAYAIQFNNPAPNVQIFSALPVAIEKIDASVPDRFILMPAYPNPFNPTTNINFMLHDTGHARLAVYDMTGREVAVLADQTMTAGTYQYTFDATSLTSGVYVYRLTFGGQVANGRLTLVK